MTFKQNSQSKFRNVLKLCTWKHPVNELPNYSKQCCFTSTVAVCRENTCFEEMLLILKVTQKSLACQLPFFFLLWACWYEWVEKSGMKCCHSRISCGPNTSFGALRCEFQVFDHEIFLHEVLKALWDVRMWLYLSVSCNTGLQWTATQRGIMGRRCLTMQTKDYFSFLWICFSRRPHEREREIMWGGARLRNLLCMRRRYV